MLKELIICLSLCGASTFAQKLSLKANLDSKQFQVTVDVSEDGSYDLQGAPSLGTWTSTTNFNALAGNSINSQGFLAGARKFFRVVRQTNAAAILVQPQSVAKYSGDQVKLEAVATGSWPLKLQWFRTGASGPVAVAGATGSSLIFSPAKSADSGSYVLLAFNPWATNYSSVVTVQVSAPVATTISDKIIHFDIQGGRQPLVTSGNYDMTANASRFYSITSSSAFLADQGYWTYTKTDEITGYIQLSQSFIYPNGLIKLTFETPGIGSFLLTSGSGYQFGRFSFLN